MYIQFYLFISDVPILALNALSPTTPYVHVSPWKYSTNPQTAEKEMQFKFNAIRCVIVIVICSSFYNEFYINVYMNVAM